MTTAGYKRLVFALSAALVVLIAFAGKFYWDSVQLRLRVAFAGEQIEVFKNLRALALSSNAPGAAQSLESVVHYYPSGTKQVSGTPLDLVVERERADAICAIVAHLRAKTGEDLGDAPEAWIQKYVHQ